MGRVPFFCVLYVLFILKTNLFAAEIYLGDLKIIIEHDHIRPLARIKRADSIVKPDHFSGGRRSRIQSLTKAVVCKA